MFAYLQACRRCGTLFIAQVKLAAITTGVDVIWFVDNSAALASVVRGKSKASPWTSLRGTRNSCSRVTESESGVNTSNPGSTGATAPPEKLCGTPFDYLMVSDIEKFYARVVWSVGVGQRWSAAPRLEDLFCERHSGEPLPDTSDSRRTRK